MPRSHILAAGWVALGTSKRLGGLVGLSLQPNPKPSIRFQEEERGYSPATIPAVPRTTPSRSNALTATCAEAAAAKIRGRQ